MKAHFRAKESVGLKQFDQVLQAWLYRYNMERAGMRFHQIVDTLVDCFHWDCGLKTFLHLAKPWNFLQNIEIKQYFCNLVKCRYFLEYTNIFKATSPIICPSRNCQRMWEKISKITENPDGIIWKIPFWILFYTSIFR